MGGRCGPGGRLPVPRSRQPACDLWPPRHVTASSLCCPEALPSTQQSAHMCSVRPVSYAFLSCKDSETKGSTSAASKKSPGEGPHGPGLLGVWTVLVDHSGFPYFHLVVTQPCFLSHCKASPRGHLWSRAKVRGSGSAAPAETARSPAAAWPGLSSAGPRLPPGSTVVSAQLPGP